ncbi:MAG TPA: hypothetical protein EYP68_00990 [Candidatus Korarchaeota archaeon]|nr:hypothetical protein [Candidatus Korarchaeota archaeon]
MAIIRVKESTYRELVKLAAKLQIELGRPVSVGEALEHILATKKLRPSDFAGLWDMSDEEVDELFKSLSGVWSRWRFPRERS